MKILALESSAVACSAALCEDETLVAQAFQNNGLTHSRTLMPMCGDLLKNCGAVPADVDVVAVAAGPGSFTGLRIGVAAAKGLAWSLGKPCAGVSTLESMAWTAAHMDMEICPVMDARRGQVYNARFLGVDGAPVRLTEDRAISLDDLGAELKNAGKPQILVGDGAALCYNTLKERGAGPAPCAGAPPFSERLGRGAMRPGASPRGRTDRCGRPGSLLPPPLPGGAGTAGKRKE